MGLREKLMKIVVWVSDVVELAKRFRAEPLSAMGEGTAVRWPTRFRFSRSVAKASRPTT
jgi:hypothetical protein